MDMSMMPFVIPASMAVKSAVALPAWNKLEGDRKLGAQQIAAK
jgi:hypothetical protein